MQRKKEIEQETTEKELQSKSVKIFPPLFNPHVKSRRWLAELAPAANKRAETLATTPKFATVSKYLRITCKEKVRYDPINLCVV